MSFQPYWAVFVLAFVAIGEWESRARWRALTVPEERRWLGHGALYLAAFILGWTLLRVSAVAMASLVSGSPFGLLNSPWIPAPVAWIFTVALLDLARYGIHFAHHHVPLLWRLHKVHHSDPDIDLSTGLRAHPIDVVIVQAGYLAAVAVLAPPVGAVVLAECLVCFQAFFTHANARLPEGIEARLRRVLVTPDLHRIHHSEREAEQNGNFGDLLPWWDRLFGTYIAAPAGGQSALVPGLRGFQSSRSLSLRFMLGLPFEPWGDPSQPADGEVQREQA